mgnify:CR=1 FL=1
MRTDSTVEIMQSIGQSLRKELLAHLHSATKAGDMGPKCPVNQAKVAVNTPHGRLLMEVPEDGGMPPSCGGPPAAQPPG